MRVLIGYRVLLLLLKAARQASKLAGSLAFILASPASRPSFSDLCHLPHIVQAFGCEMDDAAAAAAAAAAHNAHAHEHKTNLARLLDRN